MTVLHQPQDHILAISQTTKDFPNMDPKKHVHFEGYNEV